MKLVPILTAVAASLFAQASLAADKVTFATNWLAEAEHGGFYQAVADGTYAKYGLDVKIMQGGPQANNRLLLATEHAKKLRLIILDACRENPFESKMRRRVASRSVGRGLARVEPETGTLVAYAARDGQVAADGTGSNSPFTKAFLENVNKPGVEINMLFRRIRDDVFNSTGRTQEPFTYGSLPSENFYFSVRASQAQAR